MSNNFYSPIKWTEIRRYHNVNDGVDTKPAVRVYKSSPNRVTVQVRGQLRNTKGPSKYGVIASATLDLEELAAMRDAINISLAEIQ